MDAARLSHTAFRTVAYENHDVVKPRRVATLARRVSVPYGVRIARRGFLVAHEVELRWIAGWPNRRLG